MTPGGGVASAPAVCQLFHAASIVDSAYAAMPADCQRRYRLELCCTHGQSGWSPLNAPNFEGKVKPVAVCCQQMLQRRHFSEPCCNLSTGYGWLPMLPFLVVVRCCIVFIGQCISWVSTLHRLCTCLDVGAESFGHSVTLFIQQAVVDGCLCAAFPQQLSRLRCNAAGCCITVEYC